MKPIRSCLLVSLIVVAAPPLRAENVDLSTVPDRDTVQLTIYNSEDLTLVRETRKVTFKPGVNPLQFSWAGTLIDPTSVELRFLTHPEQLDVLDTTFPHDKPQMLYWNVKSEFDGDAVFRSRLAARQHDYQTVEFRAAVKPGETADLLFELVSHQGRNSRQNQALVEPGDPTP